MRVRKTLPEDISEAVALAERLGLDYPGLASDAVWVAEAPAGDVHMATIIPAFFEGCGFVRTHDVPAAFPDGPALTRRRS